MNSIPYSCKQNGKYTISLKPLYKPYTACIHVNGIDKLSMLGFKTFNLPVFSITIVCYTHAGGIHTCNKQHVSSMLIARPTNRIVRKPNL